MDASETAPAQKLITACRELAPLQGGMVKPMRVLICGIPNVGTSTLINTLVGKKAAKTGGEAGITKLEQSIVLASDFNLFDTPGMLWPRITVPERGYLLAASGAIGRGRSRPRRCGWRKRRPRADRAEPPGPPPDARYIRS